MGSVCMHTPELSRSQSYAAPYLESCRYARILAADNTMMIPILTPFQPAPKNILIADSVPVNQLDAMLVVSPQAE